MKRILVLLMVALMMFTMCGCDKKSNKDKENTKKPVDASEISIYSYKPDTLCPILSKNEANIQMLGIVFEGMITLSDSLYPDPCLADTWSVSDDGKIWTITLRRDALWHDGTVFGADDVIYTVNQIKKSQDSPFFYNVSNIKNITKLSDNKIEIEVVEPWVNFVNLLYFPIIKNGAEEINPSGFVPVGTGPYIFEDRNEGNVLYLVKNDKWWGESPETDCITVRMLPDNNTALYAFSSGSIDMTLADDMNWGRFVDPVSSSYTAMATPIFHFAGFNHRNEALALPEVRKAISCAIDRTKIIDETMMGYATEATMPIHPKWFVCGDKEIETKQNKKVAVKVLTDNNWELIDGIYKKTVNEHNLTTDFRIMYNEENSNRENIAKLIEKQLEEQGFKITLEKVKFEDYKARLSEGDYDMFIGSYIISPEIRFSPITADNNVFGFINEKMLDAQNSLKTKYSISGIEEGYATVIDCFEELNPIAGLFFEDKIMIYNNRIKGDVSPSYFDLYRGIETLRKEELK